MPEKINRICCKIVRVLGSAFVGYLFLQGLFTICCIQRVTEKVYFVGNNAFRQLVGIGLAVGITALLCTDKIRGFLKRHGYSVVGMFVLAAAVFLGVWTMNTRFWYFGDMEKIYQNAGMLLAGDYSGWQPGGYLYMWPHQNGMVLFVAFLLKFFSVDQSFLIFYGINILFYVIAVLAVAYSLRMLYPEKETHCIQTIMLICYLPYAFFCMILYGDVIGFSWGCLAIAAMLSYTRNHKAVRLFGSGVCMIFAIISKRNEMIVLAGLCILLFFDWLSAGKERGKRAFLAAVCLAAVLLGIRLPDIAIGQISGNRPEGNSMWANIAMGLQEAEDGAPGWYNCYEENVFAENNYDTQKTGEEAKSSVKESLVKFAENPAYAWRFFNLKLASEWNNPTFECFHIQNWRNTGLELSSLVKSAINDGGKINILLIYIFDMIQSVLLFGVLMYLIAADKADLKQLLFVILFLGGFLFFAVWEAKCRYTVPFFFLLIPYAFLGYRGLVESMKTYGRHFCKMYAGIAAILVLIVMIALSDAGWVHDSFKIDRDTEDYYQYIHEYNSNFENLRF
ncbi:MAG: hypothetical protein NC251_09075 [Lachnoclostridium sp.]|nr:hypothetical protein [Lachnospira sp.]MCM1248569.1 hypothetical protein [Lachnoclostridium sp.]MCM1536337.1 hypothetical protein [Clostridium sp.]